MSQLDANCEISTDLATDLALEILWRFLATALSDPAQPASATLSDRASQRLVVDAAELIQIDFARLDIPLGHGELSLRQVDLPTTLDTILSTAVEREPDYLAIFGLITCAECPPYETEYQPNGDAFFRSQQMADVGGFYRAFGLQPNPQERPDHIALELEFLALLMLKQRLAGADQPHSTQAAQWFRTCQDARQSFFRDHISWWAPSFAVALQRKAGHGHYESVGKLLAALLPLERWRLQIEPPRLPVQPKPEPQVDPCAGCAAVQQM